jgi:hypothetical protein
MPKYLVRREGRWYQNVIVEAKSADHARDLVDDGKGEEEEMDIAEEGEVTHVSKLI